MKWVFLVYLLVNPFFYWVGAELRPAQEFCYQITSLAVIGCSLFFPRREIKRDALNIVIGIFFLWFIFVYVFNNMGWTILMNVFFGLGVYLSAISTLNKEDITFLFKGCLTIGILAGITLLCQYLGFDPRGTMLRNTNGGVPKCSFFGIRAFMGVYFALLIPMVLSISWINEVEVIKQTKTVIIMLLRAMGILLWVVITVLLYFVPVGLSLSSGALLGGVGACLFYLWFRRRMFFWIVAIPVIAGGVLFFLKIDEPMGMCKTRLDMWKLVIQDIHRRPIGYGLDSFRNNPNDGSLRYFKYAFNNKSIRGIKKGDDILLQISKDGKPSEEELKAIKEWTKDGAHRGGFIDFWDNPHNIYLSIWFETGYPGLILFFVLVYFLWQRFKLSMRNKETVALFGCFLIILLSGITQFPFHVARIGHIVPVLLGLFYISTSDEVYKV